MDDLSEAMLRKHEAFAAALDQILPTEEPPVFRVHWPKACFAEDRAEFLQNIRKGLYGSTSDSTARGMVRGSYGITMEQYISLYMLIYGEWHGGPPELQEGENVA